MSWDIIIFSSNVKIRSIEELNENELLPTDFDFLLEKCFKNIYKEGNSRSIKAQDFEIDYFINEDLVSNKMVSIYGENGLFELIHLAKIHNWQIFDTNLNGMIDLDNPSNNGYKNFRKYLERITNNDE